MERVCSDVGAPYRQLLFRLFHKRWIRLILGNSHRTRDAVGPEWVPGGLSNRLCAESLHREALTAVQLIEADLSWILDH